MFLESDTINMTLQSCEEFKIDQGFIIQLMIVIIIHILLH